MKQIEYFNFIHILEIFNFIIHFFFCLIKYLILQMLQHCVVSRYAIKKSLLMIMPT